MCLALFFQPVIDIILLPYSQDVLDRPIKNKPGRHIPENEEEHERKHVGHHFSLLGRLAARGQLRLKKSSPGHDKRQNVDIGKPLAGYSIPEKRDGHLNGRYRIGQ